MKDAEDEAFEAIEKAQGWRKRQITEVDSQCPSCGGFCKRSGCERADYVPPQQKPVAVKHMMEWVDYLKRQSDYGQHMKIPSGMSAGACWELALELQQFINTTPPQRTWVGLTDEEVVDLKMRGRDLEFVSMTALRRFAQDIDAKLKEKNT